MIAETIARALNARKSGAGWMACCPAHKDRTPSLHISAGRDGRPLVHCHAGCAQADVIAVLRERGLWPEFDRRDHPQDWGHITRAWDYTDEQGRLLYQVCRFGPIKAFRPRRPDGIGGWRWGYGEVQRVLYRLPELIEAPIVFVPEGERDVETLRDFGFCATTNPGGANGWRDEFNPFFRGKEVVILPDDDPPGWTRALQIARGVLPYAAVVRIVSFEPCKDISEWFEVGHSELELITMVEACEYAR